MAFRSLSRPSSPPIAKASTSRPCFLLYFFLVTLVVIPLLSLLVFTSLSVDLLLCIMSKIVSPFCGVSSTRSVSRDFVVYLEKQRMCIGESLSFACCVLFYANECFCFFCPFGHSIKEVFQPHLPVRLPCYDLAPVTGFTLGRSSKVAYFRFPQLPWLDGRCVQGPGTYSPRHG